MPSGQAMDGRRIRRPTLWIGVSAAVVSLLLLWSNPGQVLEAKVADYLQRLRHSLDRDPLQSDRLVLVAIDDQSVDPTASPYADIWGRGGWLTRENWIRQMLVMRDWFHPSVLAYDILFFSGKQEGVSDEAKALSRLQNLALKGDRREVLYGLEQEGNSEISSILWEMNEGGQVATVFAYLFPDDAAAGQRMKKAMSPQRRDMLLVSLYERALPDGSVRGELPHAYDMAQMPMEAILDAPVWLGAINVKTDAGGVVRRVPLVYALKAPDGKLLYLPSLTLAAILADNGLASLGLVAPGGAGPSILVIPGKEIVLDLPKIKARIPVDEECRLYLNCRQSYTESNVLSSVRFTEYGLAMASKALTGKEPSKELAENAKLYRGQVEGKIAIVGQAFTGGGDIGNFPLGETVPNAMAHYYALDNILRGDYLRPLGMGWASLILVLMGVAATWAYERLQVGPASLLVGMLLPVWLVLVAVAFACGWLLPVLAPSLAVVLLFSGNSFYAYTTEARRRGETRRLFSAMVSPHVLQLMEDHPEEVSLTGRRAEATMFFSDVAGFTSISEKLTPMELSALLNRYLTPMSDIIMAEDGYVDKYEGDAIMAVWGVPYPDPDHAAKACRAALAQMQTLRGLARDIENDTGVRIDVRIGINSGEVSAGNMGSERKFQYTVMGDAVNLAARLEPINKDYGTRIIIGPNTQKMVKDAGFALRLLDRIIVKGKTEPAEIYELIEKDATPSWVAIYEEALRAMWSRDWDAAQEDFGKVLKENPRDDAAILMMTRVGAYREVPPPPDWNGAAVRASKD